MLTEYAFAFVFGVISWISSLQFAKIYPHNVKYGKYVLYLHSLCCLLGIYEFALSIYGQIHNTHLDILITFSIPSHFELFITNFIFFQWIKIYFNAGYTEEWLINCKWFAICLSIISFVTLLTSIVITSFLFEDSSKIMYKTTLFTVGSYCILMSILFISIAHLLMRRVIKTANLSGQFHDRSVCRRLLGSGIIFSSAYLIQGVILFLCAIFENGSWFVNNMILVHSVFRVCVMMILSNTLWLYSKIIRQRVMNHWKKWAQCTRLWDLNISSKKRRKSIHRRVDTEEIAFDPSDIHLIKQLSRGRHVSWGSGLLEQIPENHQEDAISPRRNLNRKKTEKWNANEGALVATFESNATLNGWSAVNMNCTLDPDDDDNEDEQEKLFGDLQSDEVEQNDEDFVDIIDEDDGQIIQNGIPQYDDDENGYSARKTCFELLEPPMDNNEGSVVYLDQYHQPKQSDLSADILSDITPSNKKEQSPSHHIIEMIDAVETDTLNTHSNRLLLKPHLSAQNHKEPKKATNDDRPSSAPQSPTNNACKSSIDSVEEMKISESIKNKLSKKRHTLTAAFAKKWIPGMLKSKSTQSRNGKIKHFKQTTPSFQELQSLFANKNKDVKVNYDDYSFLKHHISYNSSSDSDRMQIESNAMSSSDEISVSPSKSANTHIKRNKKIKQIENDTDVICGASSNPKFWRHSKKNNSNSFKRYTFSFEKAKHASFPTTTPCTSPRVSPQRARQSQRKMSQFSKQRHRRSSSEASGTSKDFSSRLAPSKQKISHLSPINGSPSLSSSNNLTVLRSSKIHNNLDSVIKKFAFSLSPSARSKSKSPRPFSLSPHSPGSPMTPKTPCPNSVKQKDLKVHPKPLTPLSLGKQRKLFGQIAERSVSNKSAKSPRMQREFEILNRKREALKMAKSKNKLDVSGVAAKLSHWKANEYKNDPRMIMLETRNRLKLRKMSSDPVKNVFRKSDDELTDIWNSDTLRKSSSSSYCSSNSSGGEYSNSEEDAIGVIYKSKLKTRKRDKKVRFGDLPKGNLDKSNVDKWKVENVCDFIIDTIPELEFKRNEIMQSGITGIEFICMQSVKDFESIFKIKQMNHIMALLAMTNDLLMDYNGTNDKILSLKSTFLHLKDRKRAERIRSMSSVC